ncbi:MAG TPA: serine/threonine-protein kinase [Kofleriaceae bacterium]|nr:serine/threonine-protein kinase [Kofleriaceae bacterium]
MNGAPAEQAHDRVGPYQLVKAIGAGGSARVDLARIDRAYGFQRHVVIKRPLEHLRSDAKASDSLRREARLGGQLRHPNLVSVLDAGRHDGYDYLVLEYVHGGSLRTLMQHDEPARVRDMPLEVALAIVRDVARGLHDAHELADEKGAPLGLVHRDVSPGNVLVGLDGAVKLADFGIAKETRVATLSGSMHGTVTYMAPEQCRGHAFDRRADIFSLGVILYELVTGQRLFWADNDVASLHRVLAGNVPRARKVKPSVPAALDDLIMSAVAHDPLRRLATAKVFADEIEAFGSGTGTILAARHVATWVHELLGPRDVPWIGAATVVDVPLVPEPEPELSSPLVDLIAAAPVDEAPPPATFGPTDPGVKAFDEIDTQPERGPAKKKLSRALIAVLTIWIAAGVATAVVVMSDSGKPSAETKQVEPPAPAPAPAPVPDKPVETVAPTESHEIIPALEEEPEIVTEEPEVAATPDKPAKKHHRRPKKSSETKVTTEPPKTGSATTKSPQVEWNPTMLLPTDKGSGTKR